MTIDRDLHWADLHNVRDLGGLPTAAGGTIRRGAVVRSASPDSLTAEGWAALDIAADHALSHERLRPLFERLGYRDQQAAIEKLLAEHGTTGEQAIHDALDSLDMAAHLRSGGLTAEEETALHTRLLG